MTAKSGKLIWVRDPALVDDEVFTKGKVISENEKQVSFASNSCQSRWAHAFGLSYVACR